MDKTINAGNDLCECTERSDGNDLALNIVAFLVLILELDPRIVLVLLVAEGDSSCFLVEILYINLENVANGNDLRGVLDPVQLSSEM